MDVARENANGRLVFPLSPSRLVVIGRWGGLTHRMSELSHVHFLIITRTTHACKHMA